MQDMYTLHPCGTSEPWLPRQWQKKLILLISGKKYQWMKPSPSSTFLASRFVRLHPCTSHAATTPATMAGGHRYKDDDDDASDSGSSDFTPNDQLEMETAQAQAQTATGRWNEDVSPSRISHSRASHIVSWVVVFSIFAAFASWWRQEKIEIGYCDVGRNHWSLDTTNVPDWVTRLLEPKCEECPQHAVCYANMDISCDPGFVLRQHPLSLYSLIPLSATCEPDGERARRVAAVVNKVLAALREQRAKFECGECLKDGTRVTAPGLSLDELKATIQRLKRKAISDQEFDDLWRGAVDELQKRNEITQTTPT